MRTPFLTPREVADRLRLSLDAVYRAIDRGDLQAVKVASRLRVSETALAAWLSSSAARASAATPPVRPIRKAVR